MQNTQLNRFRHISATILVGMFGLTGCTSTHSVTNLSGLVSQTPSSSTPAPKPTVTEIPYAYNADFDTGSTGPVGTPAAAVWGTEPPQIATTGGAIISGFGAPYPPTGTSFPVLVTGLQFAAGGGVSPLAAGKDASATVTASDVYDPCIASNYTSLQLAIPSANVNTTIYVNLSGGTTPDANGSPDPLDYMVLGTWRTRGGPTLVYLFGYETPASAVPVTGQASFSGKASGEVFVPIDGHVMQASLSGNASITADFASGGLTGALTRIQYDGGAINNQHVIGTWNDVSLTAAIAAGSNRFSGRTTATSEPSTPYSLTGSAAGHIDGAFFGPSAQAIGALWTLSDGTAAAIGTIAARR